MGKAEGAAQSLGEWDAIKTPQEEWTEVQYETQIVKAPVWNQT